MLLGLYIIAHNLLNPVFIKHFNLYFGSKEPLLKGILLTVVFVIMLIGINLSWDFFDYHDFVILNSAKLSLSQMLFSKISKLSAKSREAYSCGEITNLLTNDVMNVAWAVLNLKDCVIIVAELIVCLYLIYRESGKTVILSILVLIAVFAFNNIFACYAAT